MPGRAKLVSCLVISLMLLQNLSSTFRLFKMATLENFSPTSDLTPKNLRKINSDSRLRNLLVLLSKVLEPK